MGRRRFDIAADVLAGARKLRAAGTSWASIGAHLGYHEHTIRKRLDPDFAEARRVRYASPAPCMQTMEPRLTPAEAERALATVPPDTRTLQARFLGDPLPGRSALDRRHRR